MSKKAPSSLPSSKSVAKNVTSAKPLGPTVKKGSAPKMRSGSKKC